MTTPAIVDRAKDQPGRVFTRALLTAVAYYTLARLSYLLTVQPAHVVALWLPGGMMLALLILTDKPYWLGAIVGALLGNVAADLGHGASLASAFAGGAANQIEAVVAAWALVRYFGRQMGMGTVREVTGLVVGAALVSNAATALIGALVLSHGNVPALPGAWLSWWVGDGVSMLVVTPLALSVAQLVRSHEPLSWRTRVEALSLMALVAGVAHYVLSTTPDGTEVLGGHPYLLIPFLLVAAVRFGPWGAATGTFVVALVTVANASHAVGPLAVSGQAAVSQVWDIYLYVSLASLCALIPAAILTEQRESQRLLQRSESRFRQMAESIQETFFVIDLRSGEPLYVSPTWATVWGLPLSAAQHVQAWLDAVGADDRRAIVSAVQSVRRGLPAVVTVRVTRPDGTLRSVQSRVFPVRDDAGEIYRLAGVADDITKLREAEQRVIQAQKMEAMGRLAGGVAHDFNNLLTVILAEADFLAETPGQSKQDVASIAAIRRTGVRASALTRQLLSFSRRDAAEATVFDFNQLVEEMAGLLRRLIGENIKLVVRLHTDTGAVRADRGQIEQVITNLVVNARDAMPAGGQITLETTAVSAGDADATGQNRLLHGECVVLAVTDDGTGIEPEVQARMFEPFFTTKGAGKGTGLGLATSFQIVADAQGLLEADSQVGVGTVFRMCLPRVIAPVSVSSEAVTPSGPGAGAPALSTIVRVGGTRPDPFSLPLKAG